MAVIASLRGAAETAATALLGSLGTFVDDRVGLAVNGPAFGRPPVTNGGLGLHEVSRRRAFEGYRDVRDSTQTPRSPGRIP